MEVEAPMESQGSDAAARLVWEEPCVILEQSLVASAQGSPPGASPWGMIGPLATSGDPLDPFHCE